MKIQKDLDETKIVLHKTIEKVLERGEKIDDLVAKSDGLSAQSKMFYRGSFPVASSRGTALSMVVTDGRAQNKRRSRTAAAWSCEWCPYYCILVYLGSNARACCCLGLRWSSCLYECCVGTWAPERHIAQTARLDHTMHPN
jgi:hypothetical protein